MLIKVLTCDSIPIKGRSLSFVLLVSAEVLTLLGMILAQSDLLQQKAASIKDNSMVISLKGRLMHIKWLCKVDA